MEGSAGRIKKDLEPPFPQEDFIEIGVRKEIRI